MKAALTALALSFAGSAHAGFMSGAELIDLMKGAERQRMIALAYVAGVADAMSGAEWCPASKTITVGQVYDATKAALIGEPSLLDESADIYVRAAVRRIAPCNKPRRGTV